MADNIELNSGTGGAIVATDDDGVAHHQYVKVEFGGDGTFTKVTSAVGLPVDVLDRAARDNGKVDVAALDQYTPVDVDSGAGVENALPVTLRVVANGGSIAQTYGSGNVDAGTQRVTIAADSTGVLSVDDNGASLTVDGPLTDAELRASAVPVADGGASLTVDNATLAVVGGGVEATALRVTLASDSTGVLSVDDNGASLTVDNAALSVVGGGAEAAALRVTIANDSTGVLSVDDNGGALTVDGTVAVSSLPASTNTIEVVGDVAHDAASAGNPVRIGAKAETSPKGVTLVADGDATDVYADADGIQMVKLNTSGADLISEAVSNTDGASTAFTNFSAVANTFNYVTAITVFRSDAGATLAFIDFRDGTAGSVKWRMPLPPNGGSTISSATPLFKTSANTALAFDVSAALTTVYISVSGFQSKV